MQNSGQLQIIGQLKKVLNPETGTTKAGKEWKRQAFLIEYQDGNYTKQVSIQAKSDVVINIISNARIGDTLVCDINVESREWNDRFYTDVTAWKITKLDSINFWCQEQVKTDSNPYLNFTANQDLIGLARDGQNLRW